MPHGVLSRLLQKYINAAEKLKADRDFKMSKLTAAQMAELAQREAEDLK